MMIPLYNKSNYSLLSSLLKIDDIISYAKNHNISSIALTDDNMYGMMEFMKKCEREKIKPIIGLEIKLKKGKIVLLCKNYHGYQNKQEEKEARILTEKIVFLRECLYLEKKEKKYLSYLYKIRDGKTVLDEEEELKDY